MEYQPDALLVSGDIFDMQQPSAATKRAFTEDFVRLRRQCPEMHIVITAGNHDSASRIEADRAVWNMVNIHLVGLSPSINAAENDANWMERYVIRLKTGYIVALPFMLGDRQQQMQAILSYIDAENHDHLPVVMMGHLAVSGLDATGHGFEIGTLKTIDTQALGTGYDYFALGHIHKPQTIGHQEDAFVEEVSYPSPVIRYSGSALHVSCDETYPHSVSLVELDHHGGEVKIKQLTIDELRHFYVLPLDGTSFMSDEDALQAIRGMATENESCYFRLRIDRSTYIPENFNQKVYDILADYGNLLRYNPKHIWTGATEATATDAKPLVFEVAELQQMTDPMVFIEKTWNDYPDLDLEELREAFKEVMVEVERDKEEKQQKANKSSKKSEQ